MFKVLSCVLRRAYAGITILLSLSVFQLIVAEMVPSTSMAVPLVGRVIGHNAINIHRVTVT